MLRGEVVGSVPLPHRQTNQVTSGDFTHALSNELRHIFSSAGGSSDVAAHAAQTPGPGPTHRWPRFGQQGEVWAQCARTWLTGVLLISAPTNTSTSMGHMWNLYQQIPTWRSNLPMKVKCRALIDMVGACPSYLGPPHKLDALEGTVPVVYEVLAYEDRLVFQHVQTEL